MPYAETTTTSMERSREELEHLVERYGGDEFGYLASAAKAVVIFKLQGRQVKFEIPMPDADFTFTPGGKRRTADQALGARRQEINRLWRSLYLVVKALLVAVDDGIIEFDAAFLPYLVTANGETVAERMVPEMSRVLRATNEPLLLTGGVHGKD